MLVIYTHLQSNLWHASARPGAGMPKHWSPVLLNTFTGDSTLKTKSTVTCVGPLGDHHLRGIYAHRSSLNTFPPFVRKVRAKTGRTVEMPEANKPTLWNGPQFWHNPVTTPLPLPQHLAMELLWCPNLLIFVNPKGPSTPAVEGVRIWTNPVASGTH